MRQAPHITWDSSQNRWLPFLEKERKKINERGIARWKGRSKEMLQNEAERRKKDLLSNRYCGTVNSQLLREIAEIEAQLNQQPSTL